MTVKYAKKAQILFTQAQANQGIPVIDAAPPTWTATTAYALGDNVTGTTGRTYTCITAGTSAASIGPTTLVADITDGSVHWKLNNQLLGAWVTGTAYVLNDCVTSGGNAYICTVAGTSSVTPSGTGVNIADGATLKWARTSTFTAADAVAVFNSDFNTILSNETFQYAGSELDRDAGVTITDKYSEANAETFAPALSVIVGAPTVANFALADLFQSAGAAISYSGNSSTSDATISADNSVASTTLLTLEISKISSDRAGYQKNYRFYDCRAQVDLDITAGHRANLKWHFKGNPVDALGQAYPTETVLLTPSYGTQKTTIAPSVRLASIVQAELQAYSAAGVAPTLAAAFAGSVKNIGFSKLSAPNLFGYEYGRFLTGNEEGFSKTAVSTDVTLSIVEEATVASGLSVWNPEASTSSGLTGAMLEGFFSFSLQWGTVLGQKLYINFTKLQLMDVKGIDISGYHGKDLVFKNTGYVNFKMR
jgi:hypothetical protein